jgi:hypothetical protein
MEWTEKNDINSQIKWYMYREEGKKTQIMNAKICMRPSNGKEEKKEKGYP